MRQGHSFHGPALALMLALAAPVEDMRPALAQADRLTNVPTVVIGVSVSIWPAIVAKEKGFFAEQGLDIDFIDSGASARSIQQVAAGSAEIGSSSMVDTVRAIGAGAAVKVFLNSLAVGTHSLIAGKSIKSVMELKGKRVMTGGSSDITNLWWQAVAKHFGLDPSKDVELFFSGSTAARMSALYAGGIDATVLSTPQSFKAIQDGWTDLGLVAPYLGEFPMMIWHVNARWAEKNEKLVLAFARAHNKAVRYLIDPAHKVEVSEMLARASRASLDDALKTWDACMQVKAFVADGSITDQAVERVRDTLLTGGELKPPPLPASAYYDDRYVNAVAKENGGMR
jgi:ABC-type nitrate/sulfonate/bicarbonate transport system substrate-binding protein